MLDFFKKRKKQKEEQQQQVEAKIEAPTEEPVVEEKTGWVQRLTKGLSKSSSKLSEGITGIFTKRKLDDETLEELEDLLIMADLGVKTASYITTELAKTRLDKEISPEEIKTFLAEKVAEIVAPVTVPLVVKPEHKPHVILVCGVNGNGKTTTIGKLARQYKDEGKKVMLVACDTFRAAAVEQLAVWAERSDALLVKGKHEADAASVAYTALEQAKAENVDVVLIDTAGRLHNKKNLMDELAKIIRVIQKSDETTPHDTVLVLDATTGQNAHNQVKTFKEIVNLSGLIVTKLDGTAKGGVVVGLAKEFALPIHAVGVGESVEDLHAFDAKSFAQGLVGVD